MSATENAFQGWAIVELMGHRRLAGYCSQAEMYGAALLRVDVPAKEGLSATQFYGGGSIYCLTPTTEETARAFATRNQPAPVQRWELPALEHRPSALSDDDDSEDAEYETAFVDGNEH